jgi:hypothetical protein
MSGCCSANNLFNMRIAAITVLSLLLIPVILPEKLRVQSLSPTLQPDDPGYSDKPGLNITVFNNWYNGLFEDFSGVELIYHGLSLHPNVNAANGLMATKK